LRRATPERNAAYGPVPSSGAAVASSANAVCTGPGSMTLTPTPKPRTSKRSASESASTAYLLAWYAPPPGSVMRPPIDDTLTTRPALLARMPGRTSWVIRTSPNTLVSNCRRRASIGTSSTGPYSP